MKTITVDFDQVTGNVKPVHCVNNGPLERDFSYDLRTFFKQARIPYSRLHDTEGCYGAGHFVDVPTIFKNFDADETLPENYDFVCTDAYLQGIKDCGTDIIYRLGVTIENSAEQEWGIPMYIQPPADYLKWARVCEHITRHYNEGWADGYHMEIRYWEIWNEPESEAMWTGTFEEFTDFYIVTTRYLKAQFPALKFGGYGSIGFYPLTRHEVCCKHRRWRIPIEYIRNDDLGQYVYYDSSEKMQQEIREIYRVFSKQYNLSVVKSEKCWERFFQSVLPYAGEHTIVSRGGEPDIILNINAFSAMILGAVDLEDALIFPGVRIMGRMEELEKVFYRKHQFIDVHF